MRATMMAMHGTDYLMSEDQFVVTAMKYLRMKCVNRFNVGASWDGWSISVPDGDASETVHGESLARCLVTAVEIVAGGMKATE